VSLRWHDSRGSIAGRGRKSYLYNHSVHTGSGDQWVPRVPSSKVKQFESETTDVLPRPVKKYQSLNGTGGFVVAFVRRQINPFRNLILYSLKLHFNNIHLPRHTFGIQHFSFEYSFQTFVCISHPLVYTGQSLSEIHSEGFRYILWHVDPLLGNDREINSSVITAAK
jgi:hypothetical protein